MSIVCDCTAAPPWPRMRRLHVAGTGRWYLCRECGALREEVCRGDGTIQETRWHSVESDGFAGRGAGASTGDDGAGGV
jgi:hypothetical protein